MKEEAAQKEADEASAQREHDMALASAKGGSEPVTKEAE